MKEFEVAVEFGFNFKYFMVVVPEVNSEKEAKLYVWDELLYGYERNEVSSMEVVGVREI